MSAKINSIEFGAITINGKKYGQVVIVGDKISERQYERLKNKFGTSHEIGDWEILEIFKQQPEIIVIGTGMDGKLEVNPGLLALAQMKNIDVIVEHTPKVVTIYNDLIQKGKKVNALIHTTC